jgi:flavorubredoxin
METRLTEIADGIHQITTYLPAMDFSLNQYLLLGADPLLFHTGMRGMFPSVAEAVSRVIPPEDLRWISFGHVEADECGSMNEWLHTAPHAIVAQGMTGCMVSITDLADRAPRPLADGEVLDIGGRRLRWIDTPHVPHCWEAGLLYDETTRTLLCGDLFTQTGRYPASTTGDILGPAMASEDTFPGSSSLAPTSGTTVRQLADLNINTLAPMHGPTFTGNCYLSLIGLADNFDERVRQAHAKSSVRS